MVFLSLEVFHKLRSSVVVNTDSVKALYLCVASTLGFDTMGKGSNLTLCPKTCSGSNGSYCLNSLCLYPCSSLYTDFGAVFASFSYFLLLVSSIQLIVAMVHDSLQREKHHQSRLRKAFRTTVQKCLLGAVILATGSRAIYYTIQSAIPDKWGDILLNVYYPSLLSAFSLLICFWAELFYSPSHFEGQDFLRKSKYSVTYLTFNLLVYLLLIANIIATPFISEQEQVRMSGIVGTIFAGFLLMTLIGFLHMAIRLFFRPDWQPLFAQLAVLQINLRQQFASVLGVVSNAVMQGLIISLLVFNMVVRYVPVDGYNLYICAMVIRVTELIMPLWFCCSLWNCKEPMRLWLLNPGLVLKQKFNDVESKPLLQDSGCTTDYGTTSPCDDDTAQINGLLGEDGCCWVCLEAENPEDLFYPCNCKLHRKCIKQWVAQRASNVNIAEKDYLMCQVCQLKYKVKNSGFLCLCQGMQRRHWCLVLGGGILIMCSAVGLAIFGLYAPLHDDKKIFVICFVGIIEAIIAKIFGIRIALIFRKTKYKTVTLEGYSVSEWARRKQQQTKCETLPLPCRANAMHFDATASGMGDRGGVVSVVQVGEDGRGGVTSVSGVRGGRHISTSSSIVSVEVYQHEPPTQL